MNPLTNTRNITKLNEREAALGISERASWHNEYKDSAWIFVGGLSYELTEGDLLCVFSQYGEIVNINLVRDKKTGKTLGYGFLCYEDQRSTILAVDNLNGIKLCGRIIRVDHVNNYRMPKQDVEVDPVTKAIREKGCAPSAMPDIQKLATDLADEDANNVAIKQEVIDIDDNDNSPVNKNSTDRVRVKKEKIDHGYDTDRNRKLTSSHSARLGIDERDRYHRSGRDQRAEHFREMDSRSSNHQGIDRRSDRSRDVGGEKVPTSRDRKFDNEKDGKRKNRESADYREEQNKRTKIRDNSRERQRRHSSSSSSEEIRTEIKIRDSGKEKRLVTPESSGSEEGGSETRRKNSSKKKKKHKSRESSNDEKDKRKKHKEKKHRSKEKSKETRSLHSREQSPNHSSDGSSSPKSRSKKRSRH